MDQMFEAWHYDGETALKRDVEIRIVGNTFMLFEHEQRTGPYLFSDLKYAGEQQGASVYALEGRDGWRLSVCGDIPAELASLLPVKKRYGGLIDKFGLLPSALVLTAISGAFIAVALYTPQWLAPMIPYSVEARLGDALVNDFGGRFCHTPKGDAALKKLAKSLDSNPQDLKINVAKIDMINAVALPGHNIILFNGLVSEAKSPDAVAGVLAHEMGHVREHHVMQAMLRQLGMAVVLSGTDGSAGGMLSNILALSYGRKAEQDADKHSMVALAKASISPVPTSDFFAKMAKMDGEDNKEVGKNKVAEYMSSHPISRMRERDFLRSVKKGYPYKLSLSVDEWYELKTMCAQDKNAKSDPDLTF